MQYVIVSTNFWCMKEQVACLESPMQVNRNVIRAPRLLAKAFRSPANHLRVDQADFTRSVVLSSSSISGPRQLSARAKGFGRSEQSPESAPGAHPESPVVPSPPDLGIRKARTSWNATSLAFLGDSVWELYIRRYYFSPPTRVRTYYDNVVAKVRAEQQEVYYGILCAGDFLTAEEHNVLKWGENAKTTKPARFSKSGAHGLTYMRATALECLIGWEYLENPARLHALMCHLGLG